MNDNPNPLIDTYPVKVYDMSIKNIKERAAKAVTYKTATHAANFLGYSPHKFSDRIGVGRYARDKATGKKYAIRKITK